MKVGHTLLGTHRFTVNFGIFLPVVRGVGRFVPFPFCPGMFRPTYMFIQVTLKYDIHLTDFISTTVTNKTACVFVLQKIHRTTRS